MLTVYILYRQGLVEQSVFPLDVPMTLLEFMMTIMINCEMGMRDAV